MRTLTILAALLLTIPSLEAQKKEIKKAEKAVNSGDLSGAKSYLQQAKRIFAAADDKTRAQYYVVKAEMIFAGKNLDKEQLEDIANAIRLANNYDPSSYKNRIDDIESKLKGKSSNAAEGEYTKKNFSEAATLYTVAYQSNQDPDQLFNAARSYLHAKNYDKAFDAYSRLFRTSLTEVQTQSKKTKASESSTEIRTESAVYTGITDVFNSSAPTNRIVVTKTPKKTEEVKTNTKLPEILRGLTAASIPINRQKETVIMIDEALAKNPNDKVLLNQVFHLYRQLGEKNKYNQIMDLLIKETPNDPMLYYNFGVASAQSNDAERAIELYKKTLSLDPTHFNAKVNLSILLLEEETAIVDEMNSLGMSDADDKRYATLKVERTKLYNEVLPYLESIVASQPKNRDWVKKLMDIYRHIGQDTKMAILQEKLDE